MAAVAKKEAGKDVKLYNYAWSGKDKTGKIVKGEVRAGGEHVVMATLRSDSGLSGLPIHVPSCL